MTSTQQAMTNLSLQQSHLGSPSLDLKPLEELRAQMRDFTARFDSFVRAQRENLAAERDDFKAGLAEDRLSRRACETAIATQEADHGALLDRVGAEREERAALRAGVEDYARRRAGLAEARSALQGELAEVERLLVQKSKDRASERGRLARENARNAPELKALESRLGLVIESASRRQPPTNQTTDDGGDGEMRDLLKFTYTQVAPLDRTLKHHITVDLTTNTYELLDCQPDLGLEVRQKLVDDLNKSRDFAHFLKAVRKAFRSMY